VIGIHCSTASEESSDKLWLSWFIHVRCLLSCSVIRSTFLASVVYLVLLRCSFFSALAVCLFGKHVNLICIICCWPYLLYLTFGVGRLLHLPSAEAVSAQPNAHPRM